MWTEQPNDTKQTNVRKGLQHWRDHGDGGLDAPELGI